MADAPTVKELRSMGDVVKKANLGVKQHGITACTLCQVPECREKDNDGCFLWLRMIPNRRDCRTVQNELHVVSRQLVGALHQKSGGSQ